MGLLGNGLMKNELFTILLKEAIGKEIKLYINYTDYNGTQGLKFLLTGFLTKHKGDNLLYKVTSAESLNDYYIFSENNIYDFQRLFGIIDMVILSES